MVKNLIFLIALSVSVALSAQEESKSTEQFVSEIDKKIPQLLNDFLVPGAAIAIIKNGEVILQKGYGISDIEKEVKVTSKTGFNLGSISKNVAAWGLMKLVNEGKLELDAPVEKYLTRWHLPESDYDSDGVTIRRLLSHTAGISLHSVSAGPPYDNLPTLEDWLLGKNNGLGRVEIILEPGSKYKYSGGGYGVLQLIIEEVTGQTFEDYMQAQVLDPLGMTNSSYKIDDKIMAASASPYDNYGEATDFELFTAQAGAGLHTTIEDFTRFAMANLYRHEDFKKNNAVLPGNVIQQMMKAVPQAQGRYGYGLGYFVEPIPGTSVVLNGHRGANTGWHAMFDVNTETNDGFIMVTNGGKGQHVYSSIFYDWALWNIGVKLEDWHNAKPSIANQLKMAIDSKDTDDIAALYTELKKNQPEKYNFDEGQLNDLGYYYMSKGDLQKASILFKLNVEAFPNASNVYDSYGEVLLAQGAREQAIENYKESIKLNLGNGNGVNVLNELGISKDDLIKSLSIPVDAKILAGYEGRFQTETGATITIRMHEGLLTAKLKEQQLHLVAESSARFQALGDGSIVTFFTAATGQKGLWINERIWKKLPETPAGDSGSKGAVNSSTVNARSTGDFLVFRNGSSWGRLTDFENVLGELGSNYEQRESSTMADLDLSPYDVIIIPGAQNSDYYKNYVSNIERFDEYVAKGGTLLLELNGAEKTSVMLPRGVSMVPHWGLENAIVESDHPIFFPLSGKPLIRANAASSGYLQDVPGDALILAVETNGVDALTDRPTFIEYPYGEGQVIAALQCFHDRDGSGRGPLMESVISYALTKSWTTKD